MSTATATRGAFRVVSTDELKALAKDAQTAGLDRTIDWDILSELAPDGRHVLEYLGVVGFSENPVLRVKAALSRKAKPSPIEAYLDVSAEAFDRLTPFSDVGTR